MKKLLVTGFSLLCFPLLAQVLQPLGNGLPSKVVASFAAGNEYLALFQDSSVNPVQHTVARWNGSYWSYFPGLKTPGIISSINGEKYNFNSVVLFKDTIYVGAYIESPTDVVANVDHLYKWNGKDWAAVTKTISSTNYGIMAMTVFDGKMIVAGRFQNTLSPGIVDNIAAYNGNTWEFLGTSQTEQGTDGAIKSLVAEGNRLYIGGTFQKFAGTLTGNIAYYTASNPTWGGIGSPFTGSVDELASYNGSLAAIGTNSSLDREVRTFKNSAWSQPITFDGFSTMMPTTIAGANDYLIIGGSFIKDGNGTSILRYENDSLFFTGNKITGDFKLGQRGNEAFVWGAFSEQSTGIKYISKVETDAGDVTGYLYFDKDQNGSKNIGERGLENVMLRFEDVYGNSFYTVSGADGKLAIALPEGNYNISAYPGLHWVVQDQTNYAVNVRKGRYSYVNLGQYMAPNTQDLELHLLTASSPQVSAGEGVKYIITLKNTGSTLLNGPTVHFTHNGRLTLSTSKPAADNYDSDKKEATFTILNLNPGETRTIEIVLNLPSDANLGELFACDLKAGSLFTSNDAHKPDNYDTTVVVVQPKMEGSVLKKGTSGDWVNIEVSKLNYAVHFTNISDEKVKRVVLTDSIDRSVQLRRMHISSIYPKAKWYMAGNILVAEYNDLNLASHETNPLESNGFITYYLELYKPLKHNDKVFNTATCDFDSKWIGTSNTVVVTIIDTKLGTHTPDENLVKLFPNPASNSMHLELKSPVQGNVELLDNSGRVMRTWPINGSSADLNTSDISAGIYTLRCMGSSVVVSIQR